MDWNFGLSEGAAYRCADQRRSVAMRARREFEKSLEALSPIANALRRCDRTDRARRQSGRKGRRMKRAELRAIPSVDRIVLALGDTELPRRAVVDLVRRELAALRR